MKERMIVPDGVPEMKDHDALIALVRLADPTLPYKEKIAAIDALFPEEALELFPKIRSARRLVLGMHTLMHSQRRQEQLAEIALKDELTRLPNRHAAREAWDRRSKTDASMIVLMVDIDHFKGINDTYGHQVGDYVLQEVARRMTAAARKEDIVCRWGGEEFVGFLSCSGNTRTVITLARTLTERIRLSVCETPICLQVGVLSFSVSVSIGATIVQPGDDLLAALFRADKELYKAKDSGRNKVFIGRANRRK